MRDDMRHVLIDRPRHKPWRSKSKKRFKTIEDAPEKEGMKETYFGLKDFNDNLSPLRRFLESRVGRHWDDVYSEVCQFISLSSTMQRHILEHLDGYVIKEVQIIDGKPYSTVDGSRGYGPRPLTSRGSYTQFYVHPETGILSKAPQQTSSKPRRPQITLVTLPKNKFLQFRLKTFINYKVKPTRNRWGESIYPSTQRWVACQLKERPEDVTETRVSKYYNGEFTDIQRLSYTYTPGKDAFFDKPLAVFSAVDSEFYYGSKKLYCYKVRDLNTDELEIVNNTVNNSSKT